MAPERVAAYLGGGLLLAAWLASAAGVARYRPPAPLPRTASPEAVQLDELAAEVQSQSVRLRQRLAAAPALQTPLRNPFEFAARSAPAPRAPRRVEPLPVEAPPEQPAFEPNLALVGVAEEGSDAALVRTAMISAGDELFMVTAGQPVAGRYRVVAVGADAVELRDVVTGATLRLVLKSPVSPL